MLERLNFRQFVEEMGQQIDPQEKQLGMQAQTQLNKIKSDDVSGKTSPDKMQQDIENLKKVDQQLKKIRRDKAAQNVQQELEQMPKGIVPQTGIRPNIPNPAVTRAI